MSKTWFDPRVPAAADCVLGPMLERRAVQLPDAAYAHFEDGTRWSYAETLAVVRRTALGLQRLGVKPGDHVNVLLPNGADAIRVWFAINYLGAVYVPINLAFRGRMLEHSIATAGARLLVTWSEGAQRLGEISAGTLQDVVVLDSPPPALAGLRTHGADALAPAGGALPTAHPAQPWDTQMIIYTSGTTGPSKAVLMSYLHVLSGAEATFPYLDASDRFLANLPLFHVSGVGGVLLPMVKGGSFALVAMFNTAEFWRVVQQTQSTSVILLGVMASFLVKQPPSPADRDHGLRSVMMVPVSEDAEAFTRRFGCEVYTVFNMTEISSPLRAGPNPGPVGTCGKPRPGVEVRLVDAHDCEVAPGAIGELIVRSDRPWALTHGYYGNPDATTQAWRNGWFHTGDAFRIGDNGDYFFVDRMKDAIRRRGENISSFEVEAEVCAFPGVKEAAAVAVPSEVGEDEVMVTVSLAPGAAFDPAELIRFLVPRMPHFMVPRYVRVLGELPKTPTQKVQKHLLRAEGITGDTFDRVQAGIEVKRG